MSLNSKQKLHLSAFLHELAFLLLEQSPLKSKVSLEAERFRGMLLAQLGNEEQKFYLTSRDIIKELVTLLAKQQNMEMLCLTLSYIRSLNKGEVLIAADDRLIDQNEDQALVANSKQATI
ncbi:hypothetical protein [Tellurirhabdus rosea]|uniref:hypothetical protein n=1 Tax=Tellurirhabdus rosea TaxID=2674997 RepID=UPI002259C715|nr:hypothetical protein [Tellurirhabdus rosea]